MKHFLNFCILSILVIKVSGELTCENITDLRYARTACNFSNVPAFRDTFFSRMKCRTEAWAICVDPNTPLGETVRNVTLRDNNIQYLGSVTSDSWVSTSVSIPLGLLIFLVSTTVISVGLLVFIFIRTCAKCQRNQTQE